MSANRGGRIWLALALGVLPVGVLALLAAFAPRSAPPQQAAANAEGRAVYQKWCAGCHGDEGKGEGPGANRLLPRPRDFTRALYQVRSTATGELPTDSDLRHVIDEGMPGTSMPGWRATLSGSERDAVLRYVKSFSPAFATPPTALTWGGDPGGGQAAIDSGRGLYRRIECWKCHGDAGRGDGRSAPTLKDDFNNPIRAADLTQNWMFNGGGTTADIYHRMRTGLDGTPMPSFSDLVDGGIVTDADLWRLAHYVRSLSPDDAPRVRDVVGAVRVEGALPAGPDDSSWARAERYWLPLVGQVVLKPREFAPTVTGVWVQALHDGAALALRVSWHDPSESPDSSWRAWRGRMTRTMFADDSGAADTTSGLADGLAVQFPMQLRAGMERPYFIMGSADEPVYLWRWQSAPSRGEEGSARGVAGFSPLAGATDSLSTAAVHDHGEWRVQFTRALATADSSGQLQFVAGRAIPMAVFAWDGSNGESGTRMAIGSWVSVYLGEPARAGTYLWPLLAMLSTGGLGMLVISRAQRSGTNDSGQDSP